MLTTDLVRVRRRGGRIEARRLGRAERERLRAAAEGFVAAAQAGLGGPRAEFEAACDDVPCEPTDYKLLQGLRKLVRDRCDFETRSDVEPPAVRRAVSRTPPRSGAPWTTRLLSSATRSSRRPRPSAVCPRATYRRRCSPT